jgi:uncharacterized membrane-anchored protein YhcB (DUF1043 family)
MFSSIGSKLVLVMGVIIFMLLVSGAAYWSYSQRKIERLTADNATLLSAVSTQQLTIQTLEQHASRTAGLLETLQTDLNQAERTRRELELRLRRLNLQMMARTDAADLERRINSATQQVFRDLETITGAGAGTTPQPPASPQTTNPPPRPPQRSHTP